MKIERTKAVQFLKLLGFTKADTWDDEKIRVRLSQVPEKIEEPPEGWQELYDQLCEIGGVEDIELTVPEPPKRKTKDGKKPPRDPLGSRPGTLSSKVNAALAKVWKDEKAIVLESGITERQCRARLYALETNGRIERRRIVQYRLLPAK